MEHLTELDTLPVGIHGDTFDRMLVAQERAEKLRLITADKMLAYYDVDVLW